MTTVQLHQICTGNLQLVEQNLAYLKVVSGKRVMLVRQFKKD